MIKKLRDSQGRYSKSFYIIRGTRDWTLIGLMIAITMFAYLCVIFPVKQVFAEGLIKDTRTHELYCAGFNTPCVDSIEKLETEKFDFTIPKNIQILKDVCASRGQDKNCYKILYGMGMTESRMNANAIGDSSMSVGYFQIHKGYHPDVSDSCRKDLRCSAEWTLDRMIKNGFEHDIKSSVRLHNGSLTNPKTEIYYNEVMKFANTI